MANGSEVIKKVKDAIKAKLVELGAYVDDELPDYIMVLVANKKNKDQMDEDLSLFLGHNTERFTSWLHGVLQKLNAASFLQVTETTEIASEANTDADQMKERLELKKENSEKRKDKKEKKKKKNKDKKEKSRKKNSKKREKSSAVSPTVVKSNGTISLVAIKQTDNISLSNDESVSYVPVQDETDVSNIQVDVLNIQADPQDLMLESDEEPIISAPIPKKLTRTIKQNLNVVEEIESHKAENNQSEKKSSVRDRLGTSNIDKKEIKLKDDSSLPLKSTMEGNTGMRRVLTSSIASAVRSVTQTDRSGRVQTKLEARVKPLMSERIKRRVPDSDEEVEPKKCMKLTSVVRPVITNDPSKTSSVASRVEVTPRPRRAGSGMANTALIMRAVADAHKSVNRPAKRAADDHIEEVPMAKRKQIFTKGYHHQMKDLDEPKVRKIAITVPNAHAQLSPVADEDSFDEKIQDDSEEGLKSDDLNYEIKETISPDPLADQHTRFFITIDGMPEKSVKGRLGSRRNSNLDDEYIEEVEEWEEVEVGSVVADTPEPVKEQIKPVQQITPIVAAKKEEKCLFWPDCKEGESCNFTHPKKTCIMFPNCKFGTKCLYMHPKCKFDSSCTKLHCPFTHTAKPAAASHVSKIKCKFFPKCTDMNCPYMHPKEICRFGNFCKTMSCPFIHPEVTYGSKLKWIAPKSVENPKPEDAIKS